jgi:hypothetical protein
MNAYDNLELVLYTSIISSTLVQQAYPSHYRKHINFRGPGYFRRPAHENTAVIFVGLWTDENVEYFRGPGPCRRK